MEGREQRTCACPSLERELPIDIGGDVVPVGRDIWIPSPDAVVQPPVFAKARIPAVVGIGWVVVFEKAVHQATQLVLPMGTYNRDLKDSSDVPGHSVCLIRRNAIYVRKPASRGESNGIWLANGVDDGAFGFEDCFPRVDLCGADVCYIGAAGENVNNRWGGEDAR